MNTRKRILVVDDHPLVRSGLCQAIAAAADLEVCGEAEGWHEALEKMQDTAPDLIVLDLNLKDGSGWTLLEQLQTRGEMRPVLVLSVCDEQVYAQRVLKAGARGYLMKDAPIEFVLAAMRKVLAGQLALSEVMTSLMLENAATSEPPVTSPMEQLSTRELQVYEMLGRGLSNKTISENLGVSPKTIGTYKTRLMEKLGYRTTPELMLHARHLPAMPDESAPPPVKSNR
ncbi:MAG: response regulator transcription factor [Verrucomicrobiota bacterium]